MIASLALVLAAASAAVPAPSDEAANEIVVIGRKLERDWRGSYAKKDGKLICRTTRSTGDPAVDTIGCEAMVACMGPFEPQMDALAAADLRRKERRRQMDALVQTTIPCLEAHHDEAITRLVASRAGA